MFVVCMTSRFLAGLLWSVLLGWGAGILSVSSVNGEFLPSALFSLTFADKFIHFIAFALGGWFIDETWQTSTPGRMGGDLYDWIADFLGAIAGALFTLRTHARLERLITRP
jgi:VanZ family protein